MAQNERDLLVLLQGRILAQEMLMRTLLTAALTNTPNPLGALEEMRLDLSLAAKHGVRPTGHYEDEVWNAGLDALHYELDQIARRINEQVDQPGTGSVVEWGRSGPQRPDERMRSVLQDA